MEGYRSGKIQKINNDLKKLDEEINTQINFLYYLRQYSQEAVAKLCQVPATTKNAEEFSEVHSFVNKYLDLIENVNWKCQILEAENSANDFKFFSGSCDKELNFQDIKEINYRKDIYEPAQKPFETVVNKKLEKSLIDLSVSSEGEEEKEINLPLPHNLKRSKGEYKGLPAPITPTVKDEDLQKKYFSNNLKNCDKKGNKKDLVIYKKEKIKDLKDEIKETNKMDEAELDCYYDILDMNISRDPFTEYKGMVEHIVSPGEFYVHFLVPSIREIETMKDVIASKDYHTEQVYHSKEISELDRKKIAIEIIGEYGLWFDDSCEKKWFRVKITDWKLTSDDDLISIHLIDFGDSYDVSLMDLQPLENDLRKFPAFAQKCHLAGIYPVTAKSGLPMTKWEKESKEMFEILLESLESTEYCRIIIMEPDNCYLPESIPVQLFTKDGEKSINDGMVEYECAVHLSPPPAALPQVKSSSQKKTVPSNSGTLDNWDPRQEDFESHRNNYDLDVDDPASAIYGYVGKDYEKICYRYGETGYCYKGDACRKQHKRFDQDGFTVDEEEIYVRSVNPLQPPEVGEEFEAHITCITNINLFYCLRDEVEFDRKRGQETIISLNEFINEKSNVVKLQKLAIPPGRGQIVLGLFKVDNLWYRARVIQSTPETDMYELFFVDYGNTEVVTLSQIRKIEPRFLHLPFQAMKCQLHDIQPDPEVSKKESTGYFKSRVEDKPVIVQVVKILKGEGVNLSVRLYDMHMTDIGSELVSKKLALNRPALVPKDDNQYFPD